MEKIAKFSKRTKFKEFKKKQIDLTQEERKIVKARKAEWSDGQSAIWKAQDNDGDTMYLTHTYRAFSAAPTLKGAISKFHNFIRSTASEYKDMEIEKISRESINLVNTTFEKIAMKNKKRNVTIRAVNAGTLGTLGGLTLAEKTNKFPKKPAMLIGAGTLAGASIAKNVMHNRKLEEKTAFDRVNESFQKIAIYLYKTSNNHNEN